MNITVTHTLAPEVILLLENLTNNLAPAEKIASPEQIKEAAPVVKKSKTPTAKTTAPVEDKTETKDEPKTEEAPKQEENVTFEMLRLLTQEKAQAGKRDETKKLLTSFGAERLSAMEKEHYADYYNKLKAI